MKERIIIVLIALVFGLAVTTLGYFIYQSAKNLPEDSQKITAINSKNTKGNQTQIDNNQVYLTITAPDSDSITANRTIQVKGKTNSENTILISSNLEDIVAKPSQLGEFVATVTIDAGTNKLVTRAVAPNGEEKIDTRIISFTTEDF